MKSLAALLALAVMMSVACGPAEEAVVVDDIVAAAPDNAELLFENEYVAVMKFTLPPQAKLPLHEGRPRLVYSLSDYKLQYQPQGGTPEMKNFRTGDVHWHGPDTHAVANIGPITAEYLTVIRKNANPTPGVTSDLAQLAPDKAKVIFENQNAKVIEVSLEPGDKQPEHTAAGRLVYSLTPAKIRFTQGGETAEVEHVAGDIHYHEGGAHSVENLSDQPIKYLVFEVM